MGAAPRSAQLSALIAALELDAEAASILVLDERATILWVNAGWWRFGRENGATTELLARWGRGSCYLDGVQGPLRRRYARIFETALETGEAFETAYLCSSPTWHREFRLRVLPVAGHHLICEHTLVRVHPSISHEVDPPDLASYRDDNGFVRQCSNCSRIKRVDGRWQWVPSWVVAPPPPVSHCVCASCFVYFYGGHTVDDVDESSTLEVVP